MAIDGMTVSQSLPRRRASGTWRRFLGKLWRRTPAEGMGWNGGVPEIGDPQKDYPLILMDINGY